MPKSHGYTSQQAYFNKRDRQLLKEKQLADANAGELAAEEVIIEDGIVSAMHVGVALKRIKDEKLWKGVDRRYTSWESYIEARWTFGRRNADHLISAAKVQEVLGVEDGPQSVGVARVFAPLAKKNPDKAKASWQDLKSHYPDPTVKQAEAFLRDPLPPAPPKPMEEHLRQTLHYLKVMLNKYFPETGSRPGLRGWQGSRERKAYLAAIHRYVEEQFYLAHGLYRGKQKYPGPFEEPSAEHPDGRVYDAKDPETHQGIVPRSKMTDEYTPPKKLR